VFLILFDWHYLTKIISVNIFIKRLKKYYIDNLEPKSRDRFAIFQIYDRTAMDKTKDNVN
jgi:hypothetical protein